MKAINSDWYELNIINRRSSASKSIYDYFNLLKIKYSNGITFRDISKRSKLINVQLQSCHKLRFQSCPKHSSRSHTDCIWKQRVKECRIEPDENILVIFEPSNKLRIQSWSFHEESRINLGKGVSNRSTIQRDCTDKRSEGTMHSRWGNYGCKFNWNQRSNILDYDGRNWGIGARIHERRMMNLRSQIEGGRRRGHHLCELGFVKRIGKNLKIVMTKTKIQSKRRR